MLQLVPSSYNLGVGGQHAPRPCMQPLLGEIEFRDAGRASGNFLHLAQNLPEEWQARFRSLLAACPDPDSTLHFLDRLHREQPGAFHRLAESSSGLQILVPLFSCSRFLSETVLVHPDWLVDLIAFGDLDRPLPAEAYLERLEEILENPSNPAGQGLFLHLRRYHADQGHEADRRQIDLLSGLRG